jgi:tetratricopeptide (TPR) repeat protein
MRHQNLLTRQIPPVSMAHAKVAPAARDAALRRLITTFPCVLQIALTTAFAPNINRGVVQRAQKHLIALLLLGLLLTAPHHAAVAQGLKEAESLNSRAVELFNAGRYSEAEPLIKRSLAIRQKLLNPDHPDVAGSLNNLAALYRAEGRFADAEPLYKRSLTIREKVLGPDHLDVAHSLNNLALL